MSIPADAVDAQFVLRRNLILLTKNPLTTPGLSFLSQPFRKLMFVYTYCSLLSGCCFRHSKVILIKKFVH